MFKIGDAVELVELSRAYGGERYRSVRRGEVVEMTETRCRVRWATSQCFRVRDGEKVADRVDTKRTWIATKRLTRAAV